MALPHHFTPGTDMGIRTGTWYRLTPKGNPHVLPVGKPLFFPVTDSVSFSQQHAWNESDNLGKNIMATLEGYLPSSAANLISRYAQRKLGGGVAISACAVYMDSSPPALNVRTKLFSPDGSGSIINLLESIRADITGGTIQGDAGAAGAINAAKDVLQEKLGNKTVSGGIIEHPGWWDVDVVTFSSGGASVLIEMKDMMCKSMDVTMFAPFIGQDPSLVEINLGFGHGFRGLRESMKFGSGGGSTGGSGSGSGSPKSTPKSRGNQQSINTSSGTNTSGADPRANRINLPFGLNDIRG